MRRQRAVGRHRVGRMSAREGIALRGDVHNVLAAVDGAKRFDGVSAFLRHHIRSEPQDHVLDHRVPDVRHQHVEPDILAELLAESPIEKSHDGDEQNLLAERGQIGKQPEAESAVADVGLQPLHKPHFPIEKERCAYCLRHNHNPPDQNDLFPYFILPQRFQDCKARAPRFVQKRVRSLDRYACFRGACSSPYAQNRAG